MLDNMLGATGVCEMLKNLAEEMVDLALNTLAAWVNWTNASGDAVAPLNASVGITADTIQLSLDSASVTVAGVKIVPMVLEAVLSGVTSLLTSG